MKNLKVITLAIAILGFSAASFAQAQTLSATANATANIITPLVIAKTVDLAFGNIAAGAGGTVTLATDGTRSNSGTVLPILTGDVKAAEFEVTGETDAAFTITLPGSATLNGPSSSTMIVNAFSSSVPLSSTLNETGGKKTFQVGATLNVAASQTAGEYTGSFAVTVAYN